MEKSEGKGTYSESSSDDDEEYEDSKGNRLLGFMFGNVDNSGDLDADYLDEDAKEHLSALADKLGPSLTDIDLSEKSPQTPSDPAEQDYDEKAEDAINYEDIDEQYEGPEIHATSEEDRLLPKKEYFASEASLATLGAPISVFDEENYDEDEEYEKEHDVVEKKIDSEIIASAVSEGPKALDSGVQPSELESEDQYETIEDLQEVDDISGESPDEKGPIPLPALYIEDGMVILRFSEIFAIHEPLKKVEKRGHRYFTYREKYKVMDFSEVVEEDEGLFLKSYGNVDLYGKEAEMMERDISTLKNGLELLKCDEINGAGQISEEHTWVKMDSCVTGEPLREGSMDDLSSGWQSKVSTEIFSLDQHEWEQRVLWDTSPAMSENSVESHEPSGVESGGLLVTEAEAECGEQGLNQTDIGNSRQTGLNIVRHDSSILLESFGLRDDLGATELPNTANRFHPQLLRLESQKRVEGISEDNTQGKNSGLLQSDAIRRLNKLTLQNELMGEAWLNGVIWNPAEAFTKPKLILDLQDEQMLFEVLDHKDSKHIQLHAGAMIISPSVKSNTGGLLETQGRRFLSGWQFNISNDRFYMTGKASQHLQSNSNKGSIHSFRIHHSAPALKLQTMKLKLSNKDIANFHRPKALWYPHDNELAIKQQQKLSTQGPMKIVVKSLGGKGSKLHVDAEETISSVKAKASKKLDFKPTETVTMFYLGKELEDERSLADQDVRPNSLVHLIRTKVHLWPWAQKLPGENKPLRPPGAFKKKSDLSVKDGHVILMEYCEERPLLLNNAGMGANMCTYYKKVSPADQNGNLLRNENDNLGNVLTLEPGDKSPFLGDIRAGCSQSSLETNLYRAPIFSHRVPTTDYLLVRSAKGKLSIRRIDRIAVVGQQEPLMEVMSPGSKNLQTYMVNRMLVYVYREFAKRGVNRPIAADELSGLFSNLSDAIIRKNMKSCAILRRDRSGKPCWFMRHDFHIPPENELRKMVAPEHVCAYESMLAGLYRLKHLGITRLTLPASISSAMTQLPDEAIALAAASHIERELQITPWNLSSNFVACTSQDKGSIERLEITGVGDPTGRGLGFSYVRAPPKAPVSGGLLKKKTAAGRGGSTVTGTDADLRRLSMEAAREVLLKFNVPDELISKQTRWHRIAMIRKLSSEQAASGVKVDPTTISKYARGQRMSFLQLQQQAREKCQEIWDRQVQSLSAFDGDENESESEANSDLDSFAGDLENLLDAEECENGEEANTSSKHEKLDGVRGLKMRRRPSQVQAAEEFEDEAAEAAELCRLLMDDDEGEVKKKKKKAKSVGEGALSTRPSRPSINLQTAERVKKVNVTANKISAMQSGGSFLRNENVAGDAVNVESSTVKPKISGKEKSIAKDNNGTPFVGQLKKVKILGDKLKMFKEKKSARERFVCGACGQFGHMRTNKHCPKYRENTEMQVDTADMDKSAAKSVAPSQSQPKTTKKKLVSKSATQVPVVETPENDNVSSKTKVLPLKFRYDPGPTEKQSDKVALEATASSDHTVMSDADMGNKSVSKISKIIISNKGKPGKLQQFETDITSFMPTPKGAAVGVSSGSHVPSTSVQQSVNSERDRVKSQKGAVVTTDRDRIESRKPHLVIRPPSEKEKEPQKKIIIKRSKEKTDSDHLSFDESPQFEHRKTKRIVELSGMQRHGRQESLGFMDPLKRKVREDKLFWGHQEIRTTERQRGQSSRGYYEEERIAEIRRYEETLRREREEEELQKAKKKKKKKKKLQSKTSDDYLDDYKTRRRDRRLAERDRGAKRRSVVEIGRCSAECAQPTKRRRGGEVGLANILERILDTLKQNTALSYLFLKPVSKKEAPDYYDVIKVPMDLSTIRDKVRRMEYKDREEFRHDMWQIRYNAHAYNDTRNPGIPPLADQLMEICDYMLDAEYDDALTQAEAGIEPRH